MNRAFEIQQLIELKNLVETGFPGEKLWILRGEEAVKHYPEWKLYIFRELSIPPNGSAPFFKKKYIKIKIYI